MPLRRQRRLCFDRAMMFDELWDGELWGRVGMALLCGGIVGLERQLRGKPAGIRTSSLICFGTAMFVHMSQGLGASADPTRVLGQVVTGIGFLGAGVIMTRNGLLTGVTSAAVVWMLAAVGSAIGLGRYGAALAMATVSVAILVGVERLEHAFGALRRGVHGSASADTEDGDLDPESDSDQPPPRRPRPPRSSGGPPNW
jgi:putative Mg2+ transporter-C (MgtC) family protein